MTKILSFIIGAEFAWIWQLGQTALATGLILAYVGLSIYHSYEMWQIEQKYNRRSK